MRKLFMVNVTGDRSPGDAPLVEITMDGDTTRTIISTSAATRWQMLGRNPEEIGHAILEAMESGPFPCVVITTDERRA